MTTATATAIAIAERIKELREAIADLERAGADATSDRAKLAKLEGGAR